MSQRDHASALEKAFRNAIRENRTLKQLLGESRRRRGEPVAIVGVWLRLPGGATDLDSLWRVLCHVLHCGVACAVTHSVASG